ERMIGERDLRRHQLQALALALMWVGGIVTAASFLAKFWFHFSVAFTPFFFLALLAGLGLFIATRVL
ncbi:MAG: hypothetical protein K6T59_12350, partial [Bryobacteraceae bacterium]|nr:hypothetical protein [Bryobacteraceae bacterium]